jgi:DNA-binding transcriptional MerR regulator
MAEVTLKAIKQLLDAKLDQKLDAKLEPITIKLAAIEETLSQHTTMLDGLAKDVKTLLDDKVITMHRFERLEHWAQQVGEKLGIKLEL